MTRLLFPSRILRMFWIISAMEIDHRDIFVSRRCKIVANRRVHGVVRGIQIHNGPVSILVQEWEVFLGTPRNALMCLGPEH